MMKFVIQVGCFLSLPDHLKTSAGGETGDPIVEANEVGAGGKES